MANFGKFSMRVAQIVSSMGQESSGVQSYLASLCNALSEEGVETVLYTTGAVRDFARRYEIRALPRKRFPIASLARSPELERVLRDEVERYEIVQSNGLWQLPNVYPAQAVRGKNVKLVTMPHGTLSKWALNRSKLKKRIFDLVAGQLKAVARSDMFIATCDKEKDEIRALGYKQPIAVIPIGLDIPDIKAKPTAGNRLRRVVFIGRIHPVKGIDNLARAWGRLARGNLALTAGWELVIAGPDCGAKAGLESIIAEERVPRVRFVGELHGEAKYAFLREADLCVLPSHTENFGITIAEALACATPSIATTGTPWKGLQAEGCGWWIQDSVGALSDAISEALSLSDETRAEMGRRGRSWMIRDFSWKGVAQKTAMAYGWLLQGGARPSFVV